MMKKQTIPGTNYPLQVHERKGPPKLKNEAEAKQRRGLLAKIHIAKQEMKLNKGEYEMILNSFGVSSAADLPLAKLEQMVKLLKHYGWKQTKSTNSAKKGNDDQLAALRRRCVEEAAEMDNGEKRLAGLAMKICGTSQLVWCHEVEKLQSLLAALRKIRMEEKNA